MSVNTLDESTVEGYITNGAIDLAQDSQVNSRNIVGHSVCSNGQVLVYNSTSMTGSVGGYRYDPDSDRNADHD